MSASNLTGQGNAPPLMESSWFPDYVQSMQASQSQQSQQLLVTECPICKVNCLDITKTATGLPFMQVVAIAKAHYGEGTLFESSGLLPCGHLIGHDCRQQQQLNLHQCPICRADVRCRKCSQPLMMSCGKLKKVYCRSCILKQAVLLLNTTFIGSEECVLCQTPGLEVPGETREQHRARRERAAEQLLRERLRLVASLAYPAVDTMWHRQHAADVAEEWAGPRARFVDEWAAHPILTGPNLQRRIYGNCFFTADFASFVTIDHVVAFTGAVVELSPLIKENLESTLAWFTDLDEAMGVDASRGVEWNIGHAQYRLSCSNASVEAPAPKIPSASKSSITTEIQ
ncbi:hypothetical protein PG993_008426 [Apiospora rasikravindrae]|uniref:RING-type domain-containing protein n=1 Tax=Apiospora rasikravindrae TaxID=990691 RepID=A0ABR1T0B9_9PEZI